MQTRPATRALVQPTSENDTVDADLPMLRSFTTGLRRDLDAVVAGLTLRYNSGAVEGTVKRIKQLKAAMYGRAKPDLLRKLILLA
jgi:transposase